METRQLGSTRLRVTRIGLGLAALGRPGYINVGHADDLRGRTDRSGLESQAHSVMSRAFELGIRHFDTARSYGSGEAFLGGWLRQSGAEHVTVSSKWGYRYVADWRIDAETHEIKEHSVAMLNQQYEETLSHLGPAVNVYQIHSATLESGVLENHEVLDRLAELRSTGLLIGLSTSGPDQSSVIRKATAIKRGGEPLFATVQSTWNLLEPSAGPALANAHSAGMGVIIKEAVANGRLTARDPETSAALGTAAPDAVAIAAVLAQPWVDIVLSGASTEEQLVSNVGAAEVPADLVASLPDVAEAPEEYWAKRSRLSWT